jgi:hypothetical protein
VIDRENPTKWPAVSEDPQAWPADPLVSELSIAAKAIGIEEAALAAALVDGQTIAQVARGQGVKPHRVVVALVSDAVAQVAAQVTRGDLTTEHVRWLVALATWRAEEQIISTFPPVHALLVHGRSAAAGNLPGPRLVTL